MADTDTKSIAERRRELEREETTLSMLKKAVKKHLEDATVAQADAQFKLDEASKLVAERESILEKISGELEQVVDELDLLKEVGN